MKKQVWYGRMTFGDLLVGQDKYPVALVHEIRCKVMLNEEDIEVYLDTYGYDSYLVPSEYKGEVYFDKGVHNA